MNPEHDPQNIWICVSRTFLVYITDAHHDINPDKAVAQRGDNT